MKIVYIYADEGTSCRSIDGWVSTLRRYIPSTKIRKTFSATLISDLTAQSPGSTVLIMPGGADLPYINKLQGRPISHIRAVVRAGGAYIGTCAGAYFASSACIFESQDPNLRVVAPRSLSLFPFPAIGAARPGFSYSSEAGAAFEPLIVLNNNFNSNITSKTNSFPSNLNAQPDTPNPQLVTKVYCNGGPAWPYDSWFGRYFTSTFPKSSSGSCKVVDSAVDTRTKIIARYKNPVLERHGIHGEANPVAVVVHKFGNGVAALTGVHPELTPHKLSKDDGTHAILIEMFHSCGLLSRQDS